MRLGYSGSSELEGGCFHLNTLTKMQIDETTLGRSTIPVHPSWAILDSSKIQSLSDCPRGFFYNHILGWQTEGTGLHLAFGSGWHKAMEVLLTQGHSPQVILAAYQAFILSYQQEMNMDLVTLEGMHASKKPSNVIKALTEYAKTWHDEPNQTLHVEVAGSVPISDTRVIHVKLDSIRRHPEGHRHAGLLYSLEHKTASRLDKTFEEKWHYLFQVGTYNHFLKCMFDPAEVEGVTINGAVFRVSGNAFPRIPVYQSPEMWELWIHEANHWWDYLEWNLELLADTSPDDRVMVAFPRNTSSCSKFGCRHPHLCSVVANPLQRCAQPPFGYKQEYWDPRKKEEEAKLVIHPTLHTP